MSLQVRPVRWTDLPTLKRWRSLPSLRSHLRHPDITWLQHLQWFWRIQRDPTCRVWAVEYAGRLAGVMGLYYRMGPAAEVSVMAVVLGREDFTLERQIVQGPLTEQALGWGLTTLWAEVLVTAPLQRHDLAPPRSLIWADHYSSIYRWSIR